MSELVIKDLHVEIENKEILKGVNLSIASHEFVALLGPNGHGKSTLLQVIMGNPRYVVTKGEILFDNEDVLKMDVDERNKKGLFLAFQNPYEIPGLITMDFYRAALNAHNNGKISLYKLYKELENASNQVNLSMDMLNRPLNEGFSGGEKKRNEVMQMLMLKPRLAMLDEIDSGLDVDAINTISSAINKIYSSSETSFIVISHYARLFSLLKPTKAFVMINGKIVKEGDYSLIEKIDKEGYEWIGRELGISIKKEEKEKVSIGVCATKEATKNN